MSARVSNKLVLNKFNHFIKKLGLENENMGLDYNSTYGGWCVIIRDKETGGIHHPFGTTRYKSYNFVFVLDFCINGAYNKFIRSKKIKNLEG